MEGEVVVGGWVHVLVPITGWRLVEAFRALLTSEWLAGGWKVLHKCTMIPSWHFSYLLLKLVVSIAA